MKSSEACKIYGAHVSGKCSFHWKLVKYLSCFIERMNKVKLLHYDIFVDFALAPAPFSHPKIWDRRN